jgi:hypothetical protein
VGQCAPKRPRSPLKGRGGFGFWELFFVLNVFPSSSQWVLNIFPKFSMCSSMVFPSSQWVPQHVPNSTSLSPICFAQHCSLETYVSGSTLGLRCLHVWSEYLYIGVVLKALEFFIFYFFCDGPIKEAHCPPPKTKKNLNLECTPSPNQLIWIIYSSWTEDP